MATFYSSTTNQRDAMANIYLRDSAGSEHAVSGNMVYLNFSSVGSYSNTLAGSRESQENSIAVSDLTASHLGENAYSSWRDGRNVMLFRQANGGSLDGSDELIRNSATDDDHQMGLQTQLGILNEHNLSLQQSMSSTNGQGLSLSLGMQIPVPSFKYQPAGSAISVLNSYQSNPGNGETYGNENSRSRFFNASAFPYELTNMTNTVLNSKYIKATQQLLDEIVNLQKALRQKGDNTKSFNTSCMPACKGNNGVTRSDGNPSEHQESSGNSPSELSQSEKQELQNKMAKLLAMLDEVDMRYKRYFNEMQIVDSSFDAIAGSGAAKPYTALALQTISRHFRCLRDAIGSQIRSSHKILGEQDGSNGKGISRLRYIDQHMRQQRAIQQLGVMPQHAWRPQRGLPENSVSILRAWLFEHFLHPYPNDSEKLMLARQTGLTRSQISNWFINARVRLWKPMVEDIYKEEFGENEMDSNSSSENATKYIDENNNNYNAYEDQQSPSNGRSQTNQSNQLNLISETNGATRVPGFQNEPMDSSSVNPLLHDAICHAEGSSRLMAYTMNELSRYDNGGGVSLTLGLQHCDGNLPASDVQEGFLASRGEDMYSSSPSLGFGPSQLLNYFVA